MTSFINRIFAGDTVNETPTRPTIVDFDESFDGDLISVISGIRFHATFAVVVRTLGTAIPDRHRIWMRDRIVRKAETITVDVSVAVPETTALAVTTALRSLAWSDLPNTQGVFVTAQLSADDESRRIATEWEALQAKLALNRMNAQLELERLRYLREDIFQHPEIARTYWLDRHPDAVNAALSNDFELIAQKLGSGPGPATMDDRASPPRVPHRSVERREGGVGGSGSPDVRGERPSRSRRPAARGTDMRSGDLPAWILILTGSVAHGAIELLAAERLIYRLSAVLLLAAVLAANMSPARDQRGQAIIAALLLAGATSLWVGHASGMLREYTNRQP